MITYAAQTGRFLRGSKAKIAARCEAGVIHQAESRPALPLIERKNGDAISYASSVVSWSVNNTAYFRTYRNEPMT
jgi:hypothetical protein